MYLTNYDPFFDGMRKWLAATPFAAADVSRPATPAVDVRENDKGWTFLLDLPGVTPDGIDVHVEDDELVVNAKHAEERRRDNGGEDGEYIHVERIGGSYQRRFTLPAVADTESISANSKDGVLTITVGKKEEVLPKKITVNVS